jgi:hypothetical protein
MAFVYQHHKISHVFKDIIMFKRIKLVLKYVGMVFYIFYNVMMVIQLMETAVHLLVKFNLNMNALEENRHIAVIHRKSRFK